MSGALFLFKSFLSKMERQRFCGNMSKIGRHRYIRRTTCGSSDGERAEEGKWQWFALIERRVVDEKAKRDMQPSTISTAEGVAEGVETDCFDGAEGSE